jgi:hypothetical protein
MHVSHFFSVRISEVEAESLYKGRKYEIIGLMDQNWLQFQFHSS